MTDNIPVQEKKPRDTTNRLDVRMHKNTSFLAFVRKGTLYTFFPRGTFVCHPVKADWADTNVKWIARTPVKPILFGLLAYSKTPYKPSKGEQA
jgi:hypothetical protein